MSPFLVCTEITIHVVANLDREPLFILRIFLYHKVIERLLALDNYLTSFGLLRDEQNSLEYVIETLGLQDTET